MFQGKVTTLCPNMECERNRKKLKQKQRYIQILQKENEELRRKITQMGINQQQTDCQQNQQQLQIFTDSNNSDDPENNLNYQDFHQQDQQLLEQQQLSKNEPEEILAPLSVTTKSFSSNSVNLPERPLEPKIIFNYQSQGRQKPQALKKMEEKKINFSAQNSLIKSEQPIFYRTISNNNANNLFNRKKSSNRLFENFFITGYEFQSSSPYIQYCFPSISKHYTAILSLLYSENTLKPIQSYQGKSPKSITKSGKLSIKDTFVMILCKNENGQKQYLFGCQVQDIIQGIDKNMYIFHRLFCFISSCNFFGSFTEIVGHFLSKTNKFREERAKIMINAQFNMQKVQKRSQQFKMLLSEHLQFLYQKNVNDNQTLSLIFGNQMSVFIDVPSSSQSYRILIDYRPWNILFSPVYLAHDQTPKFKQLFGFLLVYLITQTKILLYSMAKSKVSEAIVHALELIKPLEYVNPIIMGTIKDEHQQYFNAPMSIILGLWGEQKLKKKQKIEIFVNKKSTFSNFSGIIEQNKIANIDGVVFNLDTGYTFGGGLTEKKNRLAVQLNSIIQSRCKNAKQLYKLFQNILTGKLYLENEQFRNLSEDITEAIRETQLYSFYKQKKSLLLHV